MQATGVWDNYDVPVPEVSAAELSLSSFLSLPHALARVENSVLRLSKKSFPRMHGAIMSYIEQKQLSCCIT